MAAQRVQRPSASTDADASPGCATGFSAWMNNIGRGVQDGLSRVTESMDRAADDFIRSLDPGPYPGGTYGGDPVATGVPVSMSGGGSHSGVPMATGVPVSSGGVPMARGVPVPSGGAASPSSPGAGTALAPFLLINGTSVVVRGLVGAEQHNGKEAVVTAYDLATARYTVQMVDDASLLRIKHQNLLQRSPVEVVGLQERASLNGRTGLIVGHDAERGRYHVRLGRDETVSLRLPQLVLPPGARVLIEGLTASSYYRFNGRIGAVVSHDAADGRYSVQLSDAHELRVRRENVAL